MVYVVAFEEGESHSSSFLSSSRWTRNYEGEEMDNEKRK